MMIQGFLFGIGLIAAFVVVANIEVIGMMVLWVIGLAMAALLIFWFNSHPDYQWIPIGMFFGSMAFFLTREIIKSWKPYNQQPPIPGVIASLVDIGRSLRRMISGRKSQAKPPAPPANTNVGADEAKARIAAAFGRQRQ
jgi:hypothetical protein